MSTAPLTTNPAISIRPADAADIPLLLHLEGLASGSAHWSEKQYQDLFSSNQDRLVLLGKLLDNPVAFLVAHHIGEEWELENIVVSPAEHRKGIGTELLAALLSTARRTNSKAVFLEVRASNAGAQRLYEKAGFQQTNRRKSYYQNPLEDAILYRLDLG